MSHSTMQPHNGQIVFGLGSGRCGTTSLAELLNAQPGVVCFHEINPASSAWVDGEDTVIALLNDFNAILGGAADRSLVIDRSVKGRTAPVARLKSLDRVTGMGEVAHYHLPYVELILERVPDARFPCLYRAREDVVRSFATKLRLPRYNRLERLHARIHGYHLPVSRNHWAGRQDRRWKSDPRFDKCFPSYDGLEDADISAYLGRWHDEYYATVRTLCERHPENVRIFDMEALNDPEGRRAILEFALPGKEINVDVTAHANANPASD